MLFTTPGEVAPMAAGIQKYYLPIDTISDIISYQLEIKEHKNRHAYACLFLCSFI